MKTFLVLFGFFFFFYLELSAQKSQYGLRIAPTYIVSDFKDSFIKSSYSSGGFALSLVLEYELSKSTSIIIEPGVWSSNYEYCKSPENSYSLEL